MTEASRVTVAYVDLESGELMKFRCSADNVDAARGVSSFLKYSAQEKHLKNLQAERQRLVKSQSLQGRSAAECGEPEQIKSELRKYVDENFSFEKLESDGKILEEKVGLDFVCGIEAFAQAPFSEISISQAKSLVEAVEKRAQSKLYQKKHPEDVEWRVNKVVNSLVDDLLKKNAEDIRREIVSLAAELGFVGDGSLPDAEQRGMRQSDFDSGERREMWGIAAPSGDFGRADGVASSPECGRGTNRIDPVANFTGIAEMARMMFTAVILRKCQTRVLTICPNLKSQMWVPRRRIMWINWQLRLQPL